MNNSVTNKNNKNNILIDIINNKFYNKYKVLLNEDKSLYNLQIDIEDYVSEKWKNDYLNLLKNNVELFKGKYGQHLIINTIVNLEQSLDQYKNSNYVNNKKHYTIIKKVNNDIILSVVLCSVIPFIYRETDIADSNTHKLFPKIGKDIYSSLYNIEYQNYENWYKKEEKSKKRELNYIFTFNNKEYLFNEYKLDYISFKEKIQEIIFKELKINKDNLDLLYNDIGFDLTLFLGGLNTLFSIETQRVEKNKVTRYIKAKEILNDLVEFNLNLINNNFPMVYKPNDWTLIKDKPNSAGYLLNKFKGDEDLIHTSKKKNGNTTFQKNEIVISTINHLQSIPYVINTEFLEYLIKLINKNYV